MSIRDLKPTNRMIIAIKYILKFKEVTNKYKELIFNDYELAEEFINEFYWWAMSIDKNEEWTPFDKSPFED